MENTPSHDPEMEKYKDAVAQNIYNEIEKLNKEGKLPADNQKLSIDQIRKTLDEYQIMMQRAVATIKEFDLEGKAIAVIEKLEKTQLQEIKPDTQLLNEQDFQVLMELGMSVYERNELEPARSIFLYLSSLFPFQVQPYIILATIEWRTKGAEAAATIYRNLIQGLKNPLLMLYAGDCIAHAGHKEEAKAIFEEGVTLCDQDPNFAPIKPEIQRELSKLA
jgi:hypothetical protein